ncbi:MAG: NifU family protein [Verrucomicrobiota bacterium]|nr:NifU family protein [Verrucomicrobiota bacterium]
MHDLTRKCKERLDRLYYVGYFRAREEGLRLVKGTEGSLTLYWLVDETDGVIADSRFQVFGPPLLILAAEICCEMLLRKTHLFASRLSLEALQAQFPFPPSAAPFLQHALEAVQRGVEQCRDIPCEGAGAFTTPIPEEIPSSGGISDWQERSGEEKLAIVRDLMDREVRPYIALDAGDVIVEAVLESGEVQILYQGSCTSCHASTGSTLSAIQQILQSRIHPALFVVPRF